MGRMDTHVVTIFEIGEGRGAPYVLTELLGGGGVEVILQKVVSVTAHPKIGDIGADRYPDEFTG